MKTLNISLYLFIFVFLCLCLQTYMRLKYFSLEHHSYVKQLGSFLDVVNKHIRIFFFVVSTSSTLVQRRDSYNSMRNDKEDIPIVDPFAVNDDTADYEELHTASASVDRSRPRYRTQRAMTLRFCCCMPRPYLLRSILILSIFNVLLTLLLLIIYISTNDYVWKLLTVGRG